MPDTTTPNFSLVLIQIGGSRDTWGDKANANTLAIDTALKSLTDALATKLNIGAFTDAAVLAKLLPVDGAGSGLDADKLDGNEATAFALTVHAHAISDITGLVAALAGKSDTGHTHAYLSTAGGTVGGAIGRTGAGSLPYFAAPGMTSGAIFVAAAAGTDPTTNPGDLWLGY